VQYFIYTSAGLVETLSQDAGIGEAQGLTADPDALVEMVVAAIR
jgi:hypothetical protein